jgi:hypothetical protein
MINGYSSLNNSLAIGIQGIQDGLAGAENAARQIARGGVDGPRGTNVDNAGLQSGANAGGGLLEPIVDLQLYSRSVEASAQVVKTADETLGTLLDITS